MFGRHFIPNKVYLPLERFARRVDKIHAILEYLPPIGLGVWRAPLPRFSKRTKKWQNLLLKILQTVPMMICILYGFQRSLKKSGCVCRIATVVVPLTSFKLYLSFTPLLTLFPRKRLTARMLRFMRNLFGSSNPCRPIFGKDSVVKKERLPLFPKRWSPKTPLLSLPQKLLAPLDLRNQSNNHARGM